MNCCQQTAGRGRFYCGWSAGGIIVTQLARRYPARVAGILLLAANPCFVARVTGDDCWPGMAPELFRQFHNALEQDVAATLERFEKLVTLGAPDARQAARQLHALGAGTLPQPYAARQLLQWLGTADYRDALRALRQPLTALFANNDALVPVACAAALRTLLPAAQVSRSITPATGCCGMIRRHASRHCRHCARVLMRMSRLIIVTSARWPGRSAVPAPQYDDIARHSA